MGRFDDDGDLIVVAMDEPVEGHKKRTLPRKMERSRIPKV
jgi:hypothetical protein